MKKFEGFPARMEFTSLPNLFFSRLLPEISNMAELKVTLHVMAVLYSKKGHPRFVSYGELLGNASLMQSLKSEGETPDEVLRQALKIASERGTLLNLALDRDGAAEDVYFLNDKSGRQTVAKIQSGELHLYGLKAAAPYVGAETPPDIFTLYEQNIGILTPMIADELREAARVYPEGWIRDAIKEAVNQNIRKKSYILAILERWSSEGRSDGAYPRHPKKADPDRYFKGKYGHMVRR
jgi:DNA replication protein